MLARLRRGLTFANVCSFLALVIASSTGGAYAANTIFSSDIVDGQVKRADIGPSAVDSSKVAQNSLTGFDITDNEIRNDDVRIGAIDSLKVLDRSLRAVDIEQESLSSGRVFGLDGTDIDANAITGNHVADDTLGGTDVVESSLATVPSAQNSAQLGGLNPGDYLRSRTKSKFIDTIGERYPGEIGDPACSGDRECSWTLKCDPGDVLLSGGYQFVDNGTRLISALPFNANGNDQVFHLAWDNNSTADTIRVTVLCADL